MHTTFYMIIITSVSWRNLSYYPKNCIKSHRFSFDILSFFAFIFLVYISRHFIIRIVSVSLSLKMSNQQYYQIFVGFSFSSLSMWFIKNHYQCFFFSFVSYIQKQKVKAGWFTRSLTLILKSISIPVYIEMEIKLRCPFTPIFFKEKKKSCH